MDTFTLLPVPQTLPTQSNWILQEQKGQAEEELNRVRRDLARWTLYYDLLKQKHQLLTTFTREADAKLVEIVSDIEAIRASPYISALGQRLEQETGNTGSLSTTEPLGEGIQEEKITIEEDLVLESDISESKEQSSDVLKTKLSRREQLEILSKRAADAAKKQKEAAAAIAKRLKSKKAEKAARTSVSPTRKVHKRAFQNYAPISAIAFPSKASVPLNRVEDLQSILVRLTMRHMIQHKKPLDMNQLVANFEEYCGEQFPIATQIIMQTVLPTASLIEKTWPELFHAESDQLLVTNVHGGEWSPFSPSTRSEIVIPADEESIEKMFHVERSFMQQILDALKLELQSVYTAAGIRQRYLLRTLIPREQLDSMGSDADARLWFVPDFQSWVTSSDGAYVDAYVKAYDAEILQPKPVETSEKAHDFSSKPFALDETPLLKLRAYRYHTHFVDLHKKNPLSSTVANRLDHMRPLCKFELSGICSDESCEFQHERDYLVSPYDALRELMGPTSELKAIDKSKPNTYYETLAKESIKTTVNNWSPNSFQVIKRHQKVSDENGLGAEAIVIRFFKSFVDRLSKEKLMFNATEEVPKFSDDQEVLPQSVQSAEEEDSFIKLSESNIVESELSVARYYEKDEAEKRREVLVSNVKDNPKDIESWLSLGLCELGLDLLNTTSREHLWTQFMEVLGSDASNASTQQRINKAMQQFSNALEHNQHVEGLWALYLALYRVRVQDDSSYVSMLKQALTCIPRSCDLWRLYLNSCTSESVTQRISVGIHAIQRIIENPQETSSSIIVEFLLQSCQHLVDSGFIDPAINLLLSCITGTVQFSCPFSIKTPLDPVAVASALSLSDKSHLWLLSIDLFTLKQMPRCIDSLWSISDFSEPLSPPVFDQTQEMLHDAIHWMKQNQRSTEYHLKIALCNYATLMYIHGKSIGSEWYNDFPSVAYHVAGLYLKSGWTDKADEMFQLNLSLTLEQLYYYFMYYSGWTGRAYDASALAQIESKWRSEFETSDPVLVDDHDQVSVIEKKVSEWLESLSRFAKDLTSQLEQPDIYFVLATCYHVLYCDGIDAARHQLDRILSCYRFRALDIHSRRQLWLERLRLEVLALNGSSCNQLCDLVQRCLSEVSTVAELDYQMESRFRAALSDQSFEQACLALTGATSHPLPNSYTFEHQLLHLVLPNLAQLNQFRLLENLIQNPYLSHCSLVFSISISWMAHHRHMKNAIAIIARAIRVFPTDPTILQLALGLALSQCRIGLASRYLQGALSQNPLNADVWRQAFRFYAISGLPDEELKSLSKRMIETGVKVRIRTSRQLQWLNSSSTLTTLDLSCSCLVILPETITSTLNNLETLNVSYNSLVELPESIGQLKSLTCLHAAHNQLQSLPKSIGQLEKLIELNVNSNLLSCLPDEMNQLTKLQRVFVAFNNLSTRQVKSVLIRGCELNLQGNLVASNVNSSSSSSSNRTKRKKIHLHHTLGPCSNCHKHSGRTQSFNSRILCADCIVSVLRTEL